METGRIPSCLPHPVSGRAKDNCGEFQLYRLLFQFDACLELFFGSGAVAAGQKKNAQGNRRGFGSQRPLFTSARISQRNVELPPLFDLPHKMNYRQAEDHLLSFTDYEKIPGIAYTAANYDLRRMEKLLQPLGNPHLGTKTVHIAGTKGKGSTAAMISNVLR